MKTNILFTGMLVSGLTLGMMVLCSSAPVAVADSSAIGGWGSWTIGAGGMCCEAGAIDWGSCDAGSGWGYENCGGDYTIDTARPYYVNTNAKMVYNSYEDRCTTSGIPSGQYCEFIPKYRCELLHGSDRCW